MSSIIIKSPTSLQTQLQPSQYTTNTHPHYTKQNRLHSMATVRRPKWHPPPSLPPRILHLPRPAPRRRQVARSADSDRRPPKGQLETLFGQERTFCYTIPPAFLLDSRERCREEDHDIDGGFEAGIWEEKWRFQAEILRAECKFLRMEREISAKRLQRERVFMERSLKSAVHALISAKRKIGEGGNAESVLEEEMEELKKKLSELQKSSKNATRRDPELLKGNRGRKSSVKGGSTLLQKQLHRIGGFEIQKCNMDFGEIAKANPFKLGKEAGSIANECAPNEACNKLADVEVLRRKMEGLSKGKLLKKMEEEYGLMVSGTANSASTSKLSSSSSSFVEEPLQDGKLPVQNICGGHCKVLVRRIMEQVRAETDQWSQMQEMLGQVREEMEELQANRDFWEDQAHESDNKIKSLNKTVEDWKQKAVAYEAKEKQLEDLVKVLQGEVERARMEKETVRGKSKETENNVLTRRVKGKGGADENVVHDGKKAMTHKFKSPSRLPFMDIGNMSPLVRQNSRRSVFPLQSPRH